MKSKWLSGVLAAVICLGGFNAVAQEASGGWNWEIAPYLWLAGLEGDVTVNGQKTDFDKSASDLLDAVELGGSVMVVGRNDQLVLWGALDYFSLSTDELDVEDRPQGGSLDTDMMLIEAGVGCTVDGWDEDQTIDILLGARYLEMDNDLEVFGVGTGSKNVTVLDPIVVVRPKMPILTAYVDGLRLDPTFAIGGGGDSDLVYELFPKLVYEATEQVEVHLGYRTVGYEFDGSGDNELNFSLSGLIAGVGIEF
jgi:hypothetical protein